MIYKYSKWFTVVFLVGMAFIACAMVARDGISNKERTQRTHFEVFVFDCFFPIPNYYFLDTRERDYYRFKTKMMEGMKVINTNVSTITIDDSPPEFSKDKPGVEYKGKQRIGELEIVKYHLGPEYFGRSGGDPMGVAIVSDGSTYLTVSGDDAALVEDWVQQCLKTMDRD